MRIRDAKVNDEEKKDFYSKMRKEGEKLVTDKRVADKYEETATRERDASKSMANDDVMSAKTKLSHLERVVPGHSEDRYDELLHDTKTEHYGPSTVGTAAEIEMAKYELEHAKKVQSAINSSAMSDEEIKKVAEEKKEAYEELSKSHKEKQKEGPVVDSKRNNDFHTIQLEYMRRTNAFSRFVARISGKAPKWKEVAKYDAEDMAFLRKQALNQTHEQKKVEKTVNDSAAKGQIKYSDVYKEIKRKQWRNFVTDLRSLSSLHSGKQMEENETKREERYGRR